MRTPGHVTFGLDTTSTATRGMLRLSLRCRIVDLSGLDIGCGEGANTRQLGYRANLHPARPRDRAGRAPRHQVPHRRRLVPAIRGRHLRFRDGIHVPDGHARPGRRFAGGAAGASARWVSAVLDPASLLRASAPEGAARRERTAPGRGSRWIRQTGAWTPGGSRLCLTRSARRASRFARPASTER